MIALMIMLQATAMPLDPAKAPTPASVPVETLADGSQRWSIMTCAPRPKPGEIVVCGRREENGFEGPAAGRGANRDLSAANALALHTTPCAARVGGCQVGVNVLGPPTMLVRILGKLISPDNACCEGSDATNPLALIRDAAHGAGRTFAAKTDHSKRSPIALDDPAPAADVGAAAQAPTTEPSTP